MIESHKLKGLGFVLTTFAMALCTFMEVLDLSITNVAIPYIAGNLGVSVNTGVWVITFFMVGNAIVLPISGWLAEKMGSIRLILISSILFGMISLLCGLAINFPMLVVCRFLQGVVAGPLIPMSQTLLVRIFPNGKEHMAMAVWAMVLLVGPIAGPIVGGWLTEDYDWRWIFFINVPVAIFAFFTILLYLKGHIGAMVKKKFDWWGLVFLSIGITCLQIFLDQGRELDWFDSSIIRALFAIATISIALLIVWEWNQEDPLVDVRLFKISSFAIGTVVLSVSFMVFYSTIVITPLWLENYMGYTSYKAGLCLGTTGILPLLFAPLIGKAMSSGRFKFMVGTSFLIMAFVVYTYTKFNTDVSFGTVALSRFFFGLGAAFYVAPASALPLVKVPPHKVTNASSIAQFFRIFLAGAGTSLFTSLWNNRATFHHARIASTLTDFSQTLNRFKEGVIKGLGFDLTQYYIKLNNLLDVQAYMIATNDIMFLVSITLVFMLALLSLIRVSPKDCKSAGSIPKD